MRDASVATHYLTTLTRLDELRLVSIGQRLDANGACCCARSPSPTSGADVAALEGPRDTVVRRLAHKSLGRAPTIQLIRARRYRCTGRGHVWRQDATQARNPERRSLPAGTTCGMACVKATFSAIDSYA